MFDQLINVVAPVFGVAFLGWIYSGFREIEVKALTDIVLLFAAPALVFSKLVDGDADTDRLLLVGGGVMFECIASGIVAFLVLQAFNKGGRGLYLAAMFPNTGNLGLPLALFAFGQQGLELAVIVFVAVTLLHYSLGIMIVSGTLHPGVALKTPLFHAAVLGVLCSVWNYEPPTFAMRFLEVIGDATVPLMLLSLGIRMRTVKLSRPGRAIAVVFLRMVPGFIAGLVWVEVFAIEGTMRGVIILTGVLPSAVMNFVLAEANDQQGDEVASAILIGTVLSIGVIPLTLQFIGA